MDNELTPNGEASPRAARPAVRLGRKPRLGRGFAARRRGGRR